MIEISSQKAQFGHTKEIEARDKEGEKEIEKQGKEGRRREHTTALASKTDLVSNMPNVSNRRLFSSIFFCLSLSYSVKYSSEDMMITMRRII